MLIALDINSERTGYALGGPDDGAPRAAVWTMAGGSDLPRACGTLYNSIIELSKVFHPRFVVIEAPLPAGARGSAHAALVLISLYGAACAAGRNAGATVVPVAVSKWRKHFIGHGNLKGDVAKRMTLDRCRLMRWKAENHDEGDACGVWSWGMATRYRHWAPKSVPLLGRSTVDGAAA